MVLELVRTRTAHTVLTLRLVCNRERVYMLYTYTPSYSYSYSYEARPDIDLGNVELEHFLHALIIKQAPCSMCNMQWTGGVRRGIDVLGSRIVRVVHNV
jgi:hypothetical protein